MVHRNQSKAKLALGDALLTIRGQYRAYVRERQELLRKLSGVDPRIAELHEAGVAFKLRPTPAPPVSELEAVQTELTALWLSCFLEVESARLGANFASPQSYAAHSGKLFPESSTVRNLALGVRDNIKRGGALAHGRLPPGRFAACTRLVTGAGSGS